MNFFGFFADIFRRRRGMSFRKRLGVFNYKVKKIGYHKKPGAINLQTKEQLKKMGNSQRRKIFVLERDSPRVLGKFTSHGNFIFDQSRVPFYDVPDLTGFQLKPYVSVHTPKIDEFVKKTIKELNNFHDPHNLNRSQQPLLIYEQLQQDIQQVEQGKPDGQLLTQTSEGIKIYTHKVKKTKPDRQQ